MTYTYNIPNKDSGVQIPAILTLKNKLKYKLMSAEDIAWNTVLGDDTIINTTDDLLDYISSAKHNPVTDINPIYTLYCDITVCYAGDEFDNSPEIKVYRTLNGERYEIPYSQLERLGITSSVDGDLIKFDSSKQCLDGVATPGINTLTLMKNGKSLAQLSIVVLNKALSTYSTTIYKESTSMPDTPEGGSYDFERELFTAPIGWISDVTSISVTKTIWFSVGTITSSGSVTWSTPCRYITQTSFKDTTQYLSYSVQVYKAVASKRINEDTGRPVDIEDPTPNTPIGGSYNPSKDVDSRLELPQEWYATPQDAIKAYLDTTQESLKDFYKVYVSSNTYAFSYDTTLYKQVYTSGWNTPQLYQDIEGILKSQEKTISEAIDSARADIEVAISDITGRLDGNDGQIKNINDVIDVINKNIGTLPDIGDVIDSITVLYKWIEVTETDTGGKYTIISDSFVTKEILDSNYTGREYFEKYVKLSSDNKFYHYTAYDTLLINRISSLETGVNDNKDSICILNAAVEKMTSDNIRLLVSKGMLQDVTWVMITKDTYDALDDDKKHSVDSLPITHYSNDNTTGYIYGDFYKVTNDGKVNYYRCDYPLSTSFIDILTQKITLGVQNNTTSDNKGATISLQVTPEGSSAAITASSIVLNGDTIASAIAAKDLNINNTTYLKSDGTALFAQGKTGASVFNPNGTGSLAGGNVSWNNNGDLTVNGTICADWGRIGSKDGGCWNIGYTGTSAALFGSDNVTHNQIVLSTEYLEGGREEDASWRILQDGTASFANGHVVFNNDGSATIGDLDKAHIDIDAQTGEVSLSGITATITSEQLTLIGTTITNNLKNDEKFKGIITDAVGTTVVGLLNTQDVSIGNGACYFDGTGEDAGAGHIANGAISWDKDGKLTIKGNFDLQANSSTLGRDCWLFEFVSDYEHRLAGSNREHIDAAGVQPIVLPDPTDYIGRTIDIEIYVSTQTVRDIVLSNGDMGDELKLNYDINAGYGFVPMITIADDAKSPWICWGCYANEPYSVKNGLMTLENVSNIPRFYYLGKPTSDYIAKTGASFANQGFAMGCNSAEESINSGIFANITNEGLYYPNTDIPKSNKLMKQSLILSPFTYRQMVDYVNNDKDPNVSTSSERYAMYLTLRIQARTRGMYAYWLVQTSDFIPGVNEMEEKTTTVDTGYKYYVTGLLYNVYNPAYTSCNNILNFYDYIEMPIKRYIGVSNPNY